MIKKILVIDDDVDFVDRLRDILEEQKYDVIGAFDGEDGLEKAKTESPDLILLDIIMPKLNGHEFAARIKDDDHTRSIPIIAVTVHQDLVKFFNEGEIRGYLIKPFKVGELLSKVRDCIGEAKGRKVLLVNDDKKETESLERTLRVNHFAVNVAHDGREGLEKAKKDPPQIIVVNAYMPVMNGKEFLQLVKADPALAHLPVILCIPPDESRQNFLSFNSDEILNRPVDAIELIAMIKFLLKDKALVLCESGPFLDRISRTLRGKGLGIKIVKSEQAIVPELQQTKYKLVVAYLPMIKKTPEEFVAAIRTTRSKSCGIIIYSSSKVQGTEKDNVIVIRELQRKWLKAKANEFFDLRISEADFPVVVDKSLGINQEY